MAPRPIQVYPARVSKSGCHLNTDAWLWLGHLNTLEDGLLGHMHISTAMLANTGSSIVTIPVQAWQMDVKMTLVLARGKACPHVTQRKKNDTYGTIPTPPVLRRCGPPLLQLLAAGKRHRHHQPYTTTSPAMMMVMIVINLYR